MSYNHTFVWKSFAYAFLLTFAWSCKKEKQPDVVHTPSEYFLPLKTGNFWIYRRDTDDPNFLNPVSYDTIRVLSDTLINGLRYYEVKGGSGAFIQDNWYADSAGLIITSEHNPYLLTIQSNDTILKDTVSNSFYRVAYSGNLDTAIMVPAGKFTSTEMVLDLYYLFGPPPGNNANPRQQFQYFSKGVGLVKCKGFYAFQSSNFISVLESYNVSN